MIDGVQAPRVVCFQVIQRIMILVLLEFLVKIMSKTVTFNEICDLNLVKRHQNGNSGAFPVLWRTRMTGILQVCPFVNNKRKGWGRKCWKLFAVSSSFEELWRMRARIFYGKFLLLWCIDILMELSPKGSPMIHSNSYSSYSGVLLLPPVLWEHRFPLILTAKSWADSYYTESPNIVSLNLVTLSL